MNINPLHFVKPYNGFPNKNQYNYTMDKQSLWYLENIDMKGMMCPQKMAGGHMDSFNHKTFKKSDYIYMPDEHADKIYFISDGRIKIGTYSDTGKEIT